MKNGTFAPEEQMFHFPLYFQNNYFLENIWKFELFIEMMQYSKYSIWGKGLTNNILLSPLLSSLLIGPQLVKVAKSQECLNFWHMHMTENGTRILPTGRLNRKQVEQDTGRCWRGNPKRKKKKQHQNIPLVMVSTVGKMALTNSILGIVCAYNVL